MRKRIISFIRILIITAISIIGYIRYQKYEGNIFQQTIEKKAQSIPINKNAKAYQDDLTNVNSDLFIGEMVSIQKEAIEKGINKQVSGQI